MFFQTHEIEHWINEDAPMLDLTSQLLGIGAQPSVLTVQTRQPTRVALTEEAARLFALLGAEVVTMLPSGTQVPAGTVILTIHGTAEALHRGWKVAMNLLEHACGIATRTAEWVAQVQAARDVPLLVTRKHLPGAKKIMTQAILAGGAHPHRLGLSETILIFENHLNLLGGRSALPALISQMRAAACEKLIAVECDDLPQAEQAMAAGAEIIQFDKVSPEHLTLWCAALRRIQPGIRILAAGGLRLDNLQSYALSGVDGLVLSSLYHAPPADLGVRISLRDDD